MDALGTLDSPSVTGNGASFMSGFPSLNFTGGAAAPSSAGANGPGEMYVTMNSPFNVAGQGGKASGSSENATGSAASIDPNMILLGLIVVGIVMMGVAR